MSTPTRSEVLPPAIRIVRLGEVAARFLAAHRGARVAAVFECCLYLEADGAFVCLGTGIGNGPLNVVVDCDAGSGWLSDFVVGEWIDAGSILKRSADISPPPSCRRRAIRSTRGRWRVAPEGGQRARGLLDNQSVATFDLENAASWRPDPWPALASLELRQAALELIATMARNGAPQDGLSRLVLLPDEASIDDSAINRVARPRLARVVSWVNAALTAPAPPAPLRPYGPPPPRRADGSPSARRGRRNVSDGGPDRGDSSSGLPYFNAQLPPPVDLLGLGPGLTPSGDDVLCGVLIALDAIDAPGPAAELSKAILQAVLKATTPLSAAFLAAAAEGVGAEALHRFIAAAIAADLDALPETIADLGRIGHTSGWDAMAGVVLVLRATAQQAAATAQSP